MSTYRLTYFQSRGSAELSRFIFAQAGVKYEDVRLSQEEWAKLKPTTPTGQLPLLEVDGRTLTGSAAIARFLAKRFDLAGSTDLDNAELEGIHDVLVDFSLEFGKLFREKDEAKKAEILKEVQENALPNYWGILEKRLQSSPDSWIYGNKPTYIDLNIFTVQDYVVKVFPDFLQKYPGVAKLKEAVEALPNIAQWLKIRPKTEF